MTTPTWHLQQAIVMLDKWYKFAENSLSLIDKYPVTHKFLQAQRSKQNNDCRRNAMHCKTAGLVWHDRYKMLLDTNRNLFKGEMN